MFKEELDETSPFPEGSSPSATINLGWRFEDFLSKLMEGHSGTGNIKELEGKIVYGPGPHDRRIQAFQIENVVEGKSFELTQLTGDERRIGSKTTYSLDPSSSGYQLLYLYYTFEAEEEVSH